MIRKLTVLILIGALCMSCSSKSHLSATNDNSKLKREKEYEEISIQDSVINYGIRYLTIPYRYGGSSPRGFDCSGFTSHVYRKFGYNLNRTSRDQARQFPSISKRELQTGDLVFFEGRSHNGNVGHVGIVTEIRNNGEFRFLHASINRGVTISSSDEPYYALRYLKAGRVLEQSNKLLMSRKQDIFDNNSKEFSTRKNSQPVEPKKMYDAVYHTVKSGENLAKISKDYDVPISTLQHLNNLKSKRVKKGKRLLISEAANMPDMPVVKISTILSEESVVYQNNAEPAKAKSDNAQRQFEKVETKKMESKPAILTQHNNQTATNKNSEQKTAQERTEIKTVELNIPKEQFDNQEKSSTKHKVSAGETLFSIARKYDLSIDEIKRLNNLKNNTLNVGQELIVENNSNHPMKKVNSGTPTNEKNISHTVQRGETLYSISRQYKCTVNDIRKWNSSLNDNIQAGDKIKIIRR